MTGPSYLFTETDIPLGLEVTKGPKRPAFTREKSGIDDAYFCTFESGVARTFTSTLLQPESGQLSQLIPGHRYRFRIDKDVSVQWWANGRREDVLTPPGQSESLGQSQRPPIALRCIAEVELEVRSS